MSQQLEPLLGLLDGDAAGTALICPDADVRLSHAELAELVDRLAGKLQAAGVGEGDRVAVVLPNGAEIVAVLFALASLGAATVPLNPAYTEPEFRFYLDDLDPQLLLIGESAAPNARAAAGSIPIVDVVVAAPGQPVDLRAGGRALAAAGANGAGAPERHRAAAAHERHDQPAEAGAAPAAQPDRVGAVDRGATTGSAPTTSRTARCRCSTSTA